MTFAATRRGMAGTWKVKKVESPDYSEIKEIRIFH
jgi:hypothetical protein